MPRQTPNNWKIITLLAILGSVPAIPGTLVIWMILHGPDAPQIFEISEYYFANPSPMLLHASVGAMFALLAPIQFATGIRARWPMLHRRVGRAVVGFGTLMALSAAWVLIAYPIQGSFAKYSVMSATGFGMIIGFAISVWHARKRNIPAHRIWMARALAITYGGSTAALAGIPIYIMFGDTGGATFDLLRWAGLVLNLFVVEFTLGRKLRQPLPKQQGMTQ